VDTFSELRVAINEACTWILAEEYDNTEQN
jgi:hypothetical protein